MKCIFKPVAVACAIAACIASSLSANAAVRLPAVFGDHMVLQRGMEVPVWGWANPGQKVSVTFAGQNATTSAGKNGTWQVKLPAMSASDKGRDLTVRGSDTVTLHDVLVGEVWLCSGQSNMKFAVNKGWMHVRNVDQVLKQANHPTIRLINVPNVPASQPVKNFKGEWEICTPKSVGHWTAVGYFFAVNIHNSLHVPVGLLESGWGGTRIEPWIPEQGYAMDKHLAKYLKAVRQAQAARAAKAAKHKTSSSPPSKHNRPVSHRTPTVLYNGMIAPLVPYAMRGALWYQGESNVHGRTPYFADLQALIGSWRKVWGQGDFPFIIVQIAPFSGYGHAKPTIWSAEMRASREIKNVGLASTMDIGSMKTIHPNDKQDVGKRLALWALANVYGQKNLVYSGPTFAGMKVQGDKVIVSFNHLGGGLVTSDGKAPTWFEVAGKDGKWQRATAKIVGDTVVVSSDKVSHPVAVRFAWDYKAQPNLKNKAGLPALPFDTAER